MTQQQILDKWKHLLPKVEHIPTWTEGHNMCYCAEEASKASWIVEIGTYMGASALMMLLANPGLRLTCIDTFTQFGQDKVTQHFLRDHSSRCNLIKSNSRQAAKMFSGPDVDAVFIDDGHTTDDVLRDLNAFYPLVRPGGVLFGHDFDKGSEIEEALQEFGRPYTVPVERMWRMEKP